MSSSIVSSPSDENGSRKVSARGLRTSRWREPSCLSSYDGGEDVDVFGVCLIVKSLSRMTRLSALVDESDVMLFPII